MATIINASEAIKKLTHSLSQIKVCSKRMTYFGNLPVLPIDEYMIGLISRPSGRTIAFVQKAEGANNPSIEISIHEGHRVKGAVLADRGRHYLARENGLGGNKVRISAKIFREKLSGFDVLDVGGRQFAVIDEIDSDTLIHSISDFARECDRLRYYFGHDQKDERSYKDDRGASIGGERSGATWTARHSPIVDTVVKILHNMGCISMSTKDWKPDIIRRHPCGKILLFEIKPTSGLHDIITAIGQLIVYRSHLSNVASFIVVPNTAGVSRNINFVLSEHKIFLIALDEKFKEQVERSLS